MVYLIRSEFLKFFKNSKILLTLLVFGIVTLVFGYAYGKSVDNGFLLISRVLSFLYPFVPFIFTIFGAFSISSEFENGTIVTILTSTVSRTKVIEIKILFLAAISMLFSLMLTDILLIPALIFTHFSGIQVNGYTIISAKSLMGILVMVIFFTGLSNFVYSLLGLLAGIVLRHSIFSVLAGFFTILTFNIFAILPDINKAVITSYSMIPIDYFLSCSRGMLMQTKWVPGFLTIHAIYTIVLVIFVLLIFRKIEI